MVFPALNRKQNHSVFSAIWLSLVISACEKSFYMMNSESESESNTFAISQSEDGNSDLSSDVIFSGSSESEENKQQKL